MSAHFFFRKFAFNFHLLAHNHLRTPKDETSSDARAIGAAQVALISRYF